MLPKNSMTVGMKQTHEQAMGFTRQNIDASFLLASELANAKDFPEMLEIQGRHAQRQMATYSTQAQELGRLIAGAGKSDHTKWRTTVWAECPASSEARRTAFAAETMELVPWLTNPSLDMRQLSFP